MRYYGRRRETIKNTIYIIIGLISLCFVSVKLQSLNIDEKIVVTNEEVEGQVGMESEQDLVLDVDKIYDCKKRGSIYLENSRSISLTLNASKNLDGVDSLQSLMCQALCSILVCFIYKNGVFTTMCKIDN